MHACIGAFSAGVPVIPIAYSRKFIGLFGGVLEYPHVLPMTGFDTSAALGFVLDRVLKADLSPAEVAAGNARVAPLIERYVEALTELFAQVRQ